MPRYNAGLSPKEERFIAEYLIDGNGYRSVIAAGYAMTGANARKQAHQMLQRPRIAEALAAAKKKVFAKLELTAEKVLGDIERIANKAEQAGEYGHAIRGKELLGKNLRLFTEKVELAGANDGPVEFTVIERVIVKTPPQK